MTRILVVETSSPKRVRKTAEEILAGKVYPEPDLTILCTSDTTTVSYFSEIAGVRVLSLPQKGRRSVLRTLGEFDLLQVFWTGEKKYRSMKRLALRLRARTVRVDAGDGNVFHLNWKAWIEFGLFRLGHPLPSDHYQFVPRPQDEDAGRYYQGEKILLVQSARSSYIFRALERLDKSPIFRNPRYTLFCRNTPEIVERFRNHPMIHEILPHTEARGSWTHLRALRRLRFDGMVVFFTGDPSYWKVKYFAFLLGARNKVVFNENNDCCFFSLGDWLALLAHRVRERSRDDGMPGRLHNLRVAIFLLLKGAVFPFRFAWLLLVWLRLKLANGGIPPLQGRG